MSPYTRFAGTFLLLLIGTQLPLPVSAQSAPVLSQAKAIQIATTFCKSLGAPMTGTPTTQFPAPLRFKDQPDTFWQPRWRIKFGDGAEIDVVDATGVVAYYSNYQRLHQTSLPGARTGKPMSKEQALQRANLVLQASALKGELEAPIATLQQFTYYVRWGRQFQNVPYRHQYTHVQLQPDTGDVLGFNIIFPSPAPKAGPGSITGMQAQTTGITQMATVGRQYAASAAPKLTVVQPNTFWQAGGADTPQAGVSQVAWVCHYPLADRTREWYEVWVDSTSGKVIGGEHNGSK